MISLLNRPKLREHMAFTALGLALGAVFTLGSLSLTYLLTSEEGLEDAFRKEEYAFKQSAMKVDRGLAFARQASDAEQRALDRMDSFLNAITPQTQPASPTLRGLYESNRDHAMEDRARLSGHSPETTGLPKKFHESVERFFTAEIESWQWIGRNLGWLQGRQGSSHPSITELKRRRNEMRLESIAQMSAFEDAKTEQDERVEAQRELREETQAQFTRWRWRFRLAGVGTFITIVVFYLLFTRIVFSTDIKDPAEDGKNSDRDPSSGNRVV
jgi:hypothetical protein